MGRPLKQIDAEQVYKLARLGLTHEDIAEVFNVDRSTISKRFSQEFTCARAEWKTSLRRAQTIRAVKDRSDTMLIHLGKTYLDQTDRIDVTSGGQSLQPTFERIDNNRDKEVSPPAEAKGVLPE